MSDVVLVRPPFLGSTVSQEKQEAMGLAYLCGELRSHGFTVRLFDFEFERWNEPYFAAELAQEKPYLLGISIVTDGALPGSFGISRLTKQILPQTHITVGGILPTFEAEDLLHDNQDIDSLVFYEGERIVVALAHALKTGNDFRDVRGIGYLEHGVLRRTPDPEPLTDLDALALPARDYLPKLLQEKLSPCIVSSRGCIGHCSFCTVKPFSSKNGGGTPWRARKAANVVEEIARLVRDFGVNEVTFVDDDFIGVPGTGHERARQIAGELQRRDLRIIWNMQCRPDLVEAETFQLLQSAGLRSVFLGVEGVHPNAVQVFRKHHTADQVRNVMQVLAKLGIEADMGFILFHPYATLDEVEYGVRFLDEMGQLDIQSVVNRLIVNRGAPIREQLRREGRLEVQELRRESYSFADSGVANLYAILQIAVKPMFAAWFRDLRLAREYRNQAQQGIAGSEQKLLDCRHRIAAVDRLVRRMTFDALQTCRQHGAGWDLVSYARQLRKMSEP